MPMIKEGETIQRDSCRLISFWAQANCTTDIRCHSRCNTAGGGRRKAAILPSDSHAGGSAWIFKYTHTANSSECRAEHETSKLKHLTDESELPSSTRSTKREFPPANAKTINK
jgi:hypothetical protein